MHKLGVFSPPIPTNELLVQPAEGLPHIPRLMTNVTMDEALGFVARAFRGIVLYGACTEQHLFRTHFVGGVYFDDRVLKSP
jgi:hypothetical protein